MLTRRHAFIILLIFAQLRVSAQPITSESRLKAAYVSKFPEFVEWPSAVWSERTTVDLCIAHPNPFGSELASMVSGETLNGRAYRVRQVGLSDPVDRCHVLYVHAHAASRVALLRKVAALPILTVGDSADLESSTIVTLRIVDGRVRFIVSMAAAERAGLRISSQLLRLALDVRGSA